MKKIIALLILLSACGGRGYYRKENISITYINGDKEEVVVEYLVTYPPRMAPRGDLLIGPCDFPPEGCYFRAGVRSFEILSDSIK